MQAAGSIYKLQRKLKAEEYWVTIAFDTNLDRLREEAENQNSRNPGQYEYQIVDN